MRLLILAYRHKVGLVHKDVGGHQHRVTEETVGSEVAAGQVFLHLLITGHALEPAQRSAHAEQERKLGVLEHAAL